MTTLQDISPVLVSELPTPRLTPPSAFGRVVARVQEHLAARRARRAFAEACALGHAEASELRALELRGSR